MEGKRNRQMGFGDDLLAGRISGDHWLLKIERLIDWSAFELPLSSLYSHTGRPSHPPLVMFKMLLLEQWCNLSDAEVEAQTRVRIDFLCFLGLTLTDPVPDETALVRFRQRLLQKNLLAMLFERLNEQLAAQGLLVKKGTLIDASLVQSARTPPSKDGGGTADAEAGYGVRRDTVMHGYKAHVAVDAESQIVRAVIATPANVHDSVVADALVQGDEAAVYADKAYCDEGRRERLRAEGIAPRILYRARRNRPLSEFQKAMNRRWSVVRAAVERVFADWKCRRSMARCRYVGLAKTQLHFSLLAIAHNMRRMAVLCG
ncbi:MAG: IS5 family transposase [Thiobacillaceae bacterium]|nr:IS5 family transposase [Thiobacillaceae bacterium]